MQPAQVLATYLRPAPHADPPVPLDLDTSTLAREQGVAPLVYRAMRERRLLDEQPAGVRQALGRLAREEAVTEALRRSEAGRVLAALAAAGVGPLIFKGTALAYTCYPDPALRPRLDTDLLIRRQDVESVSRVFEGLGYERTLQTSGELVTHQFTYATLRHGVTLAFDVHWKISNPHVFAALFTFDELERDARPVPGLGPFARTLCPADALLVACLHRVAHHHDLEVLIDLYDINLLAEGLDAQDWNRVARLAAEKRLRAVVLRGLRLASERLGTTIPGEVEQRLTGTADPEPTAAYLDAGLRKVDLLRADLRQLAWPNRLRLLREHVFPSPAFVLRSFGRTEPLLLPALYLIRIARGAGAWFRRIP